jgi:hypothetical protein
LETGLSGVKGLIFYLMFECTAAIMQSNELIMQHFCCKVVGHWPFKGQSRLSSSGSAFLKLADNFNGRSSPPKTPSNPAWPKAIKQKSHPNLGGFYFN